jgi:hypothetical protein
VDCFSSADGSKPPKAIKENEFVSKDQTMLAHRRIQEGFRGREIREESMKRCTRNWFSTLAIAVLILGLAGCHAATGRHAATCDTFPCDASPEFLDSEASCSDKLTFDNELDCDDDAFCDSIGGPCDACDALPARGSGQLARGRRIKWLDDLGSFVGTVNKIALWDKRADNHRVSPQTERAVLTYLRRNQLDSVLVRSNQYDPLGEWKRLVANKRMAAPWKYTFGTYDWLRYTLVPGRVFGGDWYNPFTDSVHLYSDIPAIGLAKAAYAKDVHGREYPGTYASVQDTPLLGLWHETLANQEAIRYVKRTGTRADVAEAERILIPDFGGAIGAQALGFLPYGHVYGRAAGALGGHVYRELSGDGATRQASQPSTTYQSIVK